MNEIRMDKELMGNLECFCMFIGYPYSGHSLVGSIIDAHPNAVISHELHVGRLLKKGYPREKIFSMIILNAINFGQHGRTWNNYTYAIPGEWNGRYETIRVIGDKKGGGSTKFFTKKAEIFDIVDSSFGIPVKYIHVMRNPFDIISTLCRKRKTNSQDQIRQMTDKCIQHIENAEQLRQQIPPEHWFDIYHEQLLAEPDGSITALFRFLGLETPEGFTANCEKIMYKSPHQSRLEMAWTETEKDYVLQALSRFPRFSTYTFES